MQIREELRQFVIDNFLFGEEDGLQDQDSFLEKGIVDSTGVLELVGFIEKHFAIKLEDRDLTPDNLDSIERISHFLLRRGAGK